MGIASEFKEFAVKGNVVDMAVGVVIGVAFGAVVTALVEDLFTPLIAAIGGKPDFSSLTFTINAAPAPSVTWLELPAVMRQPISGRAAAIASSCSRNSISSR